MRTIQTKKHKIGTYETKKKSLSVSDSKRSVSDDGIHSQAYFYKEMQKIFTDKKDSKRVLIKKRFSQIKEIQKSFHKEEDIITDKKDSKKFSWKKRFSQTKRFS